MRPADDGAGLDTRLQAYGRFVVCFLGNCMVDPHRYFEQKLNGQIDAATPAELRDLIALLAGWVASDLLDDRQRILLAQALGDAGLPSVQAIGKDLRLLEALLAGPGADADGQVQLRAALADPDWGTGADRALAAAALAA
jgi:hypothetical protein